MTPSRSCRAAFVLLVALLLGAIDARATRAEVSDPRPPRAASSADHATEAEDSDGDGMTDADEQWLGCDPAVADPLELVVADTAEKPDYDPGLDVQQLHVGHVAEDRYLWRITFAAPPDLEQSVVHLYVDADSDTATGRRAGEGNPITGTDYMLTLSGAMDSSRRFEAAGQSFAHPTLAYRVVGRTLWMTSEIDLSAADGAATGQVRFLCHGRTDGGSRTWADQSGRIDLAIPRRAGAKLTRLGLPTENIDVHGTFGHRTLNRVLTDPANIVVRPEQLETEGMEPDIFTSYRYPHFRRTSSTARAWTTAPKPGRYHVGLMVYDDPAGCESLLIGVDRRWLGVAVAAADNNRFWLLWTEEPYEFRGGERIELQCGQGGGECRLSHLVLLPDPPEPREVDCRVENVEVASDVDRPGRITLSWTTTWPCPTRLEYGRDAGLGTVITRERPMMVHRVVLENLDPASVYHARAVGTSPDGEGVDGARFTFTPLGRAAGNPGRNGPHPGDGRQPLRVPAATLADHRGRAVSSRRTGRCVPRPSC